jgi:transcriptional regulator with XRE-family HTH domain
MNDNAKRPSSATLAYRGVPYTLDLTRCRRALVQRQVEGELATMEALAAAAGTSRSTASRFFGGRAVSLDTTLRILSALRVEFNDVARARETDAKGPCDG